MKTIIKKTSLLLLLLVFSAGAMAQRSNVLSLPDLTVRIGSDIQLPVNVNNTDQFTAMQFDIELPTEFSFTANDGVITPTYSNRCTDHECTVKKISGNKYRCMLYSPSNAEVKGQSGTLLYLPLKVSTNINDNTEFEFTLNDVAISDVEGTNILTETTTGKISIASLPDLIVNSVTTTAANIIPGDRISLAWSVKNLGDENTADGWNEQIYLLTADGTANKLLTTLWYDQTLASSGIVSRNADIDIPAILGLDGECYLQVKVVPSQNTGEPTASQGNNTGNSGVVTVNKLLTLTANETNIVEGNTQAIIFKLTRSGNWNDAETFTITYTNDSRVTAPETVTIAAGQASKSFTVNIADNETLQNDYKKIVVKAAGNGYDEAATSFTIEDDELPELELSAPSFKISEGQTIEMTVTAERNVAEDTKVNIACDYATKFTFPSEVTIPAGNNSATFSVSAKDDEIPSLTTEVTFRATAQRHLDGEFVLLLEDDDMPVLELDITPNMINEGDGVTAIAGVLRRTTNKTSKITIKLSDNSDGGLYFGTKTLEMASGVEELNFNFGPIDNDQVDGERTYTITAAVYISSCSCNASGESAGAVTAQLKVLDNDGPTLTLTSSSATLKEGGTATLTVKRNTATDEPLTVIITGDNDAAFEDYDHTVVIPAGSESATVTLVSKANDISDDSFTTSFLAEAEGFSSGTCWMTISDQSLPDAVVSMTSNLSEVTVGGEATLIIEVGNNGFASLAAEVPVDIYFNGAKETIYTTKNLAVGETEVLTHILTMPTTIGTGSCYATINSSKTVKEINFNNNTSNYISLKTIAPYTATVSVDKSIYEAEETVAISGQLTGSKIANQNVEVYIINNGSRFTVSTESDTEGKFTAEWTPYSNLMGKFNVGACYAGENLRTAMATFDIYGIKLSSNYAELYTTVGETKSGSVNVSNPGTLPLTGIKATLTSEIEGTTITVDIPDNIPGGESVTLNYTIISTIASNNGQWVYSIVKITSNEGVEKDFTIKNYAQNPKATLVVSQTSIKSNVNKDSYKDFQLTIMNNGKGSSGIITLALPNNITSLQGTSVPSLEQNETAVVTLRFTPSESMQLNVPVNGKFGISCQNGSGADVSFEFTPVSDQTGTLVVDVMDENTYQVEGAPHLGGANVELRNSVTNALISQGITGEDGIYSIEVPEGYYKLTVTSDNHDSYQNNISIDPATETNVNVNLSISNTIVISYEVVPIEGGIEDEYEIVTTVTYETNVPVPVVELSIPSKIAADELEEGESLVFYATLTNHGLINAEDVELLLPEGFTHLSFEPLAQYTGLTLASKQAVTIPVKVTRVADSSDSGESAIRKIKNIDDDPCASQMGTLYWWDCGLDRKWHRYDIALQVGSCKSNDPSTWDPTGTRTIVDGPTGPTGGGGTTTPIITGGGGYSLPYINVPTVRTSTSEDKGCEPCQNRDLAKLLNCAAGFIPVWGCISGLYQCGSNIYNQKWDWRTLAGCASAAIGCIPGLGTVWDILNNLAGCAIDLSEPCDLNAKYRNNGKKPSKVSVAMPDYMVRFKSILPIIIEETEAFRDYNLEIFGDQAWLNCTPHEIEAFLISLESNTNELLDASKFIESKPSSISETQLEYFIERLNNTQKENTDSSNYIDSDKINEYLNIIKQSEEASVDLGYGSTDEMWNSEYSTYLSKLEEVSESVCSSITLQFNQSLVMTREAFRGTLTVFNGHESLPMENVKLNLTVISNDGKIATNKEFEIYGESLKEFEGEVDLTSGWTLDAQKTGVATIVYIPSKFAAPTEPVVYSFGGTLTYTDPFTGLEVTRILTGIPLTVNPTAELDLDYFIQRDIIGDDPLTEDIVEPCEPAEFALLINNKGYGDATNLNIVTYQPEITANDKGLLNRFYIESSQLNGADKTMALGETINDNFGTIPAQSQAYAQWWLHSDLLGHFTSYDVTVNHVTSYGNENLSLIDKATPHKLVHGFTVTNSGDVNLRGFLVNDELDSEDQPDAVYFTNATNETIGIGTATISKQSDTEYKLTVTPDIDGWNYGNLLDPTLGKQKLISIVRTSDNKEIPDDNVWQTDRTLRDGNTPLYENRLHFVVNIEGGAEVSYILTFMPKPDVELEVAGFSGVENGEKVYGSVSDLTVEFNKAIDPTTFTTDDISLICQGSHVDTSDIAISQMSDTQYSLNLGEAYSRTGYYELTVQTAGITDTEGFNGAVGKSVNWLQFGSVTLNITDVGVATLILPFDDWTRSGMQIFTCDGSKSEEILALVENDDVKAGNRPIFTAYDFDKFDEDINSRPVIEANTPYLVKGNPGTYEFWGMWDEPQQYSYSEGWLTGVLKETQLTASEGNNQYVLQNKNGKTGFYRVDSQDITVPAYKVYLTVPASASANIRAFFIDGESTDIKSAVMDAKEAQIYNTSGAKLSRLQKGVNIIRMSDGTVRKVYVK